MAGKLAMICVVITAAACTTVTRSETFIPVQLVDGEQVKIWGVEARREDQSVKLTGQVTRGALPRGPLRQHVHVEILNPTGIVLASQDAAMYPFIALRETSQVNCKAGTISTYRKE